MVSKIILNIDIVQDIEVQNLSLVTRVPAEVASDVKWEWHHGLRDPSTLLWQLSFTESRCPAKLWCVTLAQQQALPCPEAP